MAWETSLDRLLVQQIHQAESGDRRKQEVARVLRDVHELAPERPETGFHLGYARTLLGADLPEPTTADAQRWYRLGRVRGHDRLGERHWVAELLSDRAGVLELISEPRITAQFLPIAMRNLFWSGELDLAVQLLGYMASTQLDGDAMLLVDAGLSDLLTRLEKREDDAETETTLSILEKCVQLPCFDRLANEVRARYLRELGRRRIEVSDFDAAIDVLQLAFPLAAGSSHPALQSSIAYSVALASVRHHDVGELVVAPTRERREIALQWIGRAIEGQDSIVPEALFMRGLFGWETGDFDVAIDSFDGALQRMRRVQGRDKPLIDRMGFYLAGALLASESTQDCARALRLMDQSLSTVQPDLETFYSVHEALKKKDRKIALRFLDAIDIGRGTAPDQLLFVALEYLSLGEPAPALAAAERILGVSTDLDQRIEAMRVVLTSHNMQGQRDEAARTFESIRDLLLQRGAFDDLERLLQHEDFVGQALDHLEIKFELVALYELMEDRSIERATLQQAIARTLRSRKDVESLRHACALLQEVEIDFPDLVRDDLAAIQKMLAQHDAPLPSGDASTAAVAALTTALGRLPRVLVVGGNERQRRHHPRLEALAGEWNFDAEWLEANYSSPQKLVSAIDDRLRAGVDLLILLHWNRHETTEPALECARRAGVPARTVHYAGFTSLQVALAEQFERMPSVV